MRGQRRIVLGVPARSLINRTVHREPLCGVLAERLEQPERRDLTGVGEHHRLLHESREHLDGIAFVDDRSRCAEVESTCEDRQASERVSFVLRKKAPAPIDCGAHRCVPFDATPTPCSQHIDVVTQPVGDVGRSEGADSDRGQLDGQRDAVEALADLADHARVVHSEPGDGGIRPGGEESHRLRVDVE